MEGELFKLVFQDKNSAQGKSLHFALDFSASVSTPMSCVDIPLPHTHSPNAWCFCVSTYAPRSTAQTRGLLQKAVLPLASTCTAWFPLTRDRFVATWERTAVLPALGAAEPEGSSPFRPCSGTGPELPFLWRLTVVHDEAVGFLPENAGGTTGPFPLWERPLPWEWGCEGRLCWCASICNLSFENSFPFGCRGESIFKLVAKGVGKCCHDNEASGCSQRRSPHPLLLSPHPVFLRRKPSSHPVPSSAVITH